MKAMSFVVCKYISAHHKWIRYQPERKYANLGMIQWVFPPNWTSISHISTSLTAMECMAIHVLEYKLIIWIDDHIPETKKAIIIHKLIYSPRALLLAINIKCSSLTLSSQSLEELNREKKTRRKSYSPNRVSQLHKTTV
jgi:hypothetical protein